MINITLAQIQTILCERFSYSCAVCIAKTIERAACSRSHGCDSPTLNLFLFNSHTKDLAIPPRIFGCCSVLQCRTISESCHSNANHYNYVCARSPKRVIVVVLVAVAVLVGSTLYTVKIYYDHCYVIAVGGHSCNDWDGCSRDLVD